MRLRRSSNPKLMLGSESAIEGAAAEARGGRMPLVESEGSNEEDMLQFRVLIVLSEAE
jgi:RNA polymerase I-specific transcription initiation factor RRN6